MRPCLGLLSLSLSASRSVHCAQAHPTRECYACMQAHAYTTKSSTPILAPLRDPTPPNANTNGVPHAQHWHKRTHHNTRSLRKHANSTQNTQRVHTSPMCTHATHNNTLVSTRIPQRMQALTLNTCHYSNDAVTQEVRPAMLPLLPEQQQRLFSAPPVTQAPALSKSCI